MSQFPVNDQVILASAGSGKTFALSDRIVKLLALGAKPEQIVALTFTRAAAAEFVARTLEKLAQAASSEEEAADLRSENRLNLPETCDAAFFRDLLRKTLLSMQRLTLGTLDSFFARLVTNNPTEVGLDGGRISNISDVEAADIRTQVIAQMMAETDPSEIAEIWDLLRFLNQGKVVATPLKGFAETVKSLHDLVTLAKEESNWGDAGTIWPQGRPEIFKRPDEAEIAEAIGILANAFDGQTIEDRTRDIFVKHFASLVSGSHAADFSKGDWEKLSDKHAAALRPNVEEATILYWNKPVRLDRAACAAYRVLARKGYAIALEEKLAQTKAMHRLLVRYDEIYDREIRQRGRLTFSDNVTLLLNAEGKFDIDYRLDCSVKHWLFDEFQDTSTRQWKVLEENLLEIMGGQEEKTEWRTAFFVGDLKQSLYGWRAGNPELLRMVDSKIANDGDNRLDFTRRCAQPIVELVNRLLGGLEPHGPFFSPEAAAQWAKIWGNHESKNKDNPQRGEALWVRLKNAGEEVEAGDGNEDRGSEEEEESSKVASQAKWIGAHLQSTGLTDQKGLLKPGITCAILVSKNSQAAEITEQLRRMGIEAADEAAAEIAMDNPFTAGIVSLVKNTAHPTDRLSKGMAEMSPSAKAFVDACGGWEQARHKIAEVFYEKGGEALLQELLKGRIPTGETNAERFLAKRVQQILALAVKFDEDDHRDLGRFATHLEKSSLRDTADPRSVQVLTIHRSKGLQYTAVYLPCLNSDKQKIAQVRVKDPMVKTDEAFIPEWVLARPKTEVCEADPATLEAVLTKERTAAAYENLCRIYVGMTRAIRRLVLVTDDIELETREQLTEDKMERKYDFAMLVEAVLGGTTSPGALAKEINLTGACPAEIVASHGSDEWIVHAIKAQPATAEAPVRDVRTLTPVRRTERLRPSKSGKAFEGGWRPGKDTARGKVYGTLVHELFNHLEWDAEAFLSGLAAQTWSVESPALYDEAVAAIEACLKSAPVAELLLSKPAGAILWNERKATLMHEGKAISAVFDRVHVIPGHSATVIDYKTNDCSLAHLKETYQGQMDLYRIAVAKLCGLEVGKVRCVLVHVRKGELVEV
ncbi:MAG: UvrD-helicase domain-containing protein [Opitutales bacterium]|nr:UvrD-helicase domain-containing protein [Opitutales bacterium]